jgi:DnaJ-domain-containing protein 1
MDIVPLAIELLDKIWYKGNSLDEGKNKIELSLIFADEIEERKKYVDFLCSPTAEADDIRQAIREDFKSVNPSSLSKEKQQVFKEKMATTKIFIKRFLSTVLF